MAHVQKNNRVATGHLFDHYGRNAEDEKYKYLYRSNDSIDPERTKFNYNLAPDKRSQKEILDERLSQVKVLKRKDVNVMCSWVLTAPKDLEQSQLKDFFKESYDFLSKRYGEKNVISSYVHMDETTPHMHFAFIPVVHDKKKDIDKVSAKEVLTKVELQRFHGDLQNHLDRAMIRCNVLNEATREGNKSIKELKRETAIQEAEKLREILSKTEQEVQRVNTKLISLKGEYEVKKAYIEQSERDSEVSMMYPQYAEVTTKGLIHKQEFVTVPKDKWEAKHVSANEVSAIRSQQRAIERQIEELKNSDPVKELNELKSSYKALETELRKTQKENRELRKGVRDLKEQGKAMFDTLKNHGLVPEANENFRTIREAEKVAKHVMKRHMDMDRDR